MVALPRKKILVLGSNGLLGAEVIRHFSKGAYDVKGASHSELDITKGQEVAIWIERLHPDFVINCAALSNVDYCEEHPEEAYRVNAEGVKNICVILEETGGKLVHISTDYVFDGEKETPYEETDPVNPRSVYAESKLKGEEVVKRFLPESLIVRVQWLYGKDGKNFSSRVIREIAESSYTSPYLLIEDRVGSPTEVSQVAKGLEALIQNNCSGLFHFSSSGHCSWLEFGYAIFDICNDLNAPKMIQAVREKDIQRPARRPRFSAFSCHKLKKESGYLPSHWKEMLRVMIKAKSPVRDQSVQ